jgi:hypothetical protein
VAVFSDQPASQPIADQLVTQEKAMIETALADSSGRVSGSSGAAVKLGLPLSTLESKIQSLKISKHRFNPPSGYARRQDVSPPNIPGSFSRHFAKSRRLVSA